MVCWCWGLLRFAMMLIWGYRDLLIQVYDGVGNCWLRCWCGELLSDVYGCVLLLLMWGLLIEVYDGVLMWGSFDWGLWWCADVGICWWGFMMVCWCGDPLVEVCDGLIDWWLMIAYIALFSALLSRLIALACSSTWVTSFIAHFCFVFVFEYPPKHGVLMWGSADWDLSWYWDLLIIMIAWFLTLTCIHLHVSRFHFLQNNLHHLQGLIDKWRSVCQQAILDLHQLTPDPRPSLTQLVQQLGIDTKLVCYNDEEECFDATWRKKTHPQHAVEKQFSSCFEL